MMEPSVAWGAILTLALLAALVLWLRVRAGGLPGLGAQRRRGPLELVQRLPLTPQHSLHVVRAGGESVWVITFPNGAVLHRAPDFLSHLQKAENAEEARSR